MTGKLKEVGETTRIDSNPASPERGGTLTRRHSRKRSEESGGSGTLKRRQSGRNSVDSMGSNASTPTPSMPGTPVAGNANSIFSQDTPTASPMEMMPSCMTDSMFSLPPPPDDLDGTLSLSTLSLDSLPPPPPQHELDKSLSGSQVSLASLPPPPPELSLIVNSYAAARMRSPETPEKKFLPSEPIYAKTMKPAIKAPPYKAPPPYNGVAPPLPPPAIKTVSFAESPVLLRRKVCFEDQVKTIPISPKRQTTANVPAPPPRAEFTRLSHCQTSPKRLAESTSNPPVNFLKDLQRVMRKKWQVAQKCKMEPTTTPHEVLGFRDVPRGQDASSHYYNSANVSNWIQENFGDQLYENMGNNLGMEPMFPAAIKKRPPPPPPKRADSTHLTTQQRF